MPTNLAPTDLSNNTSHSPFVVGASTFQAPYDAWWAFRGDAGPGWIGSNSGVDWLQIDLGSAQAIGSYAFAAQESSSQTPKAWTLQGSADGSTWTVLDTQSGVTVWNYLENRTFILAAPATFRYYRLNFTANNGGVYTRAFNFALYAPAAAPVYSPGDDIAPHSLTDNFSVAPFVATSSPYYSSLDAWRAFDGNSTDVWLGQAGPPWRLGIDLGYAQILGSYAIQITLVGVGSPPSRGPGAWTMQGSADGVTWTVLDTRSGILWATEGQIQTFTCASPASFRYLRINITANGPGGDGYVQIAQLFLYAGAAGTGPSLTAQTITFPPIPTHTPTDAPFALAASSDSGLPVTYAVTAGPATVSGNTITLTGALGSVTIQATQAGNGSYSAAPPVNQTFAVSARTPQIITFPPISNGAANDPSFVMIGSSDSGLPLSYAVTSGLATIWGNVVTITGVGSVTIEATQAGNGSYAPATPVDRSFTVAPAQRGCIAYDQIKASDRTGNGNQLLTYSPAPASATSPGTPGQVAFDAAGNWYFCYGVNQWGRIGPTGYGSAAASPPSW